MFLSLSLSPVPQHSQICLCRYCFTYAIRCLTKILQEKFDIALLFRIQFFLKFSSEQWLYFCVLFFIETNFGFMSCWVMYTLSLLWLYFKFAGNYKIIIAGFYLMS
jgi:hypothetical protein